MKALDTPLALVTAGSAPSDEALCHAFLEGDGAAFGTLVERHRVLVFSLVRRYTSRPEDAADLCQQAFLRALEASHRFFARWRLSGPIPFRAWLIRIALNLAKNHARRGRRWLQPVELPELEASSESAQEALERTERERQVRAAVLTLPRRQREVLTLRVDAGLAFRDIAETLGITESNAKVNFHHAVKRLRARVAGTSEEER